MLDFTLHAPEALGVPSDAIRAILERGHELGLHSWIMLRHGKCIAEAYFTPYAPNKRHRLYSLSKSFTSIACAFAVQEGYLNYEDRVADFFPDKIIPEEKRDLTIEHLLTMSVGTETTDHFFGIDWVQDFLSAVPAHKPGTVFRYDTSATFMVAAILTRVTGRSLECYLNEKLLAPLGIDDHHWELSPEVCCRGGFGFNVRTRDIARFGQFLLQRGMWEGKQLLRADLIDRATAKHIENGTPVEGQPCDWAMGYGYQFWRCEPEGVYRGDGAYGQYCIVMPAEDVVIAVNSGSADMQGILTAIWRTLQPTIGSATEENPTALAALRQVEASAHIAFPEGTPLPAAMCGRFALGEVTLMLQIENDELRLYRMNGDAPRLLIRAGYGRWIECGERSYAYACEGNVVHLREVHHFSPFGHQHDLTIDGDTMAESVCTFSGCIDPSGDLFTHVVGSKSVVY